MGDDMSWKPSTGFTRTEFSEGTRANQLHKDLTIDL